MAEHRPDTHNVPSAHEEPHLSQRSGWLRAAVMGANDGILSTASLIVGVAAGGADQGTILLSGIAGMVAGAMSMAAGEYVSVSSQADVERADVEREKRELKLNPAGELAELAAIYRQRGLSEQLADEVARELTRKDALGAHLRDEIGLTDLSPPKPVEAGVVSAATFAGGALVPLLMG
ncbi:MAG: VIT1/CCC1 transporter family protein, partial [Paracoccaceae bacterium]